MSAADSNNQQDPRPQSSRERQPNQQQPNKLHTRLKTTTKTKTLPTTTFCSSSPSESKVDPQEDPINNKQQKTTNSAPATLFDVSGSHHQFLQQVQAHFIPSGTLENLDKFHATRQTGNGAKAHAVGRVIIVIVIRAWSHNSCCHEVTLGRLGGWAAWAGESQCLTPLVCFKQQCVRLSPTLILETLQWRTCAAN